MKLSASETESITKIAETLNLKEYEIITTPGSSKGNNFLGIIKAVTLKTKKESFHLILKSARYLENGGEIGQPTDLLYSREAYMYRVIFPEFSKFQQEENILKPFDSYAKFYTATLDANKECIVMEDLKHQGYEMSDKKYPMSTELIKAVLVNYAKFHAVSLAMNKKRPELFEKLSRNARSQIFNLEHYPDADGLIAKVVSNAFKVASGDKKIIEELKVYQSNLRNVLNYDPKDAENLVIIHSDCWCNNFLFKKSDTEKYPLVKIIDWQLSILTSPAFDVAYFLIINSSEDVLNNYASYLRFYYDALSDAMEGFKLKIKDILPYNLFETQFRKHVKHGFYISLIILKLTLCEQDDSLDPESLDFTDFMNFETENLDFYHQRIGYLVQFMHKNGLFL